MDVSIIAFLHAVAAPISNPLRPQRTLMTSSKSGRSTDHKRERGESSALCFGLSPADAAAAEERIAALEAGNWGKWNFEQKGEEV